MKMNYITLCDFHTKLRQIWHQDITDEMSTLKQPKIMSKQNVLTSHPLHQIDRPGQQTRTAGLYFRINLPNPQPKTSHSIQRSPPPFQSDFDRNSKDLTGLRGRQRLGGQLGRGGGRLGQRGRLFSGGGREVREIVGFDLAEEIELVLRAHLCLLLPASIPDTNQRSTNPITSNSNLEHQRRHRHGGANGFERTGEVACRV
jgi:hypothetical protein